VRAQRWTSIASSSRGGGFGFFIYYFKHDFPHLAATTDA